MAMTNCRLCNDGMCNGNHVYELNRRTPDETQEYWTAKMAEWLNEKKALELQYDELKKQFGGMIDQAHAILTAAGVEDATGRPCDDKNCNSKLIHRINDVLRKRDEQDRLNDELANLADELHGYACDCGGEGKCKSCALLHKVWDLTKKEKRICLCASGGRISPRCEIHGGKTLCEATFVTAMSETIQCNKKVGHKEMHESFAGCCRYEWS